MASIETQLPALKSPSAIALAPGPDEVEYPEGNWIAQSVEHGNAVQQATTALRHYFRERAGVLVAMELLVYYQRGNVKAQLQPDLQVVFGVEYRPNRGSYRIWEEGKPPDFVLEVASPSTAKNDAEHKAREFARIGVREYWRLDPAGTLMETPLEGYEINAGQSKPVRPAAGTGGVLRSRVLGLDLRSERQAGTTVVVFTDPHTGEEFDGSLEAAERDKQELQQQVSAAEQRARAAERDKQELRQRAIEAEERARLLEERLRSLTAHAPPPERDP